MTSATPSSAVRAQVSELYALAQDSPYVFASPLGPFAYGGGQAYLPQLAFFGPEASDDSWRLALLGGLDHRDSRSSEALLALVASLALNADAGHGLNLSFFPVVDAAGLLLGAPPRGLGAQSWATSPEPEIRLLEQDARRRGYHGFVRVESAPSSAHTIDIRLRRSLAAPLSPELELIAAGESDALPVRFEIETERAVGEGPLSFTDDLPVAPFEIIVRVPSGWAAHGYQRAVVVLLKNFLSHYRAFQAYGQHL